MKLIQVCVSYNRPEAVNFQRERGTYDGRVFLTSGEPTDLNPGTDLIHLKCPGRVHVGLGRNVALGLAMYVHGPEAIYAMLDDDVDVKSESLREIRELMESHRGFGGLQPAGLGATGAAARVAPDRWHHITAPATAAFYDGKAIEEIGYHDWTLTFKEDTDYGIRLLLAGYKPVVFATSHNVRSLERFRYRGGFEAWEDRAKRTKLQLAGARKLAEIYPWGKVSRSGAFLFKPAFNKLSTQEKIEWASKRRLPCVISKKVLRALSVPGTHHLDLSGV